MESTTPAMSSAQSPAIPGLRWQRLGSPRTPRICVHRTDVRYISEPAFRRIQVEAGRTEIAEQITSAADSRRPAARLLRQRCPDATSPLSERAMTPKRRPAPVVLADQDGRRP